MDKERYSQDERIVMSQVLEKKLGPHQVVVKQGHWNRSLHYIQDPLSVQLANNIFGTNGWKCEILQVHVESIERSPESNLWVVLVTCHIRITLRDTTQHEDMGSAIAEHSEVSLALSGALSLAQLDARRRTLRLFGQVFGNCLYDKNHLSFLENQAFSLKLIRADYSLLQSSDFENLRNLSSRSSHSSE